MFMPMHMFHFKCETGTVWYLTEEATVHDRTKEDTEDERVEALRTSQHDRGADPRHSSTCRDAILLGASLQTICIVFC